MFESSYFLFFLPQGTLTTTLETVYLFFEVENAPVCLVAIAFFSVLAVVQLKTFGSEVEDFKLKVGDFKAESG